MKNLLLAGIIIFMCLQELTAQVNNIGINTGTPHPSAVLDVYAKDKGILIPRVQAEGRVAIQNPATSLIVFDLDSNDFFFFDGARWQQLNSTADSIWIVKENFIYTKQGLVAIGTDSALALLHIHSDTTNPQFMLSTPDYRTIIGLDETDGTIFVNGDSVNGQPHRRLSLDSLGHLGLNVKDPQEIFHAFDSLGVFIKLENPDYNSIIGLDETDGTIIIGRDSSGTKKHQLVIDTAGRVGIGEVDTAAQLNVSGKVKSRGLVITNGTDEVELGLDNQGNLTMPQNTSNFYYAYRSSNIDFSTNGTDLVPWNAQVFAPSSSSIVSHNTSSSADEITINETGYYKITYSLSVQNVDTRKLKIDASLYKNGVLIPGSRSYNGARDDSEDNYGNLFQTAIANFNAGDLLQLKVASTANGGSIYTLRLLANGCSITVEKL